MKIAFTISSANYLSFAKALGDSLVEHNKDYTFYIILLDKIPNNNSFSFLPHSILEIEALELPAFEEMNGKYNIFELSCALKPFCIEYLLRKYSSVEVLCYFDSDILVFNKLVECDNILKTHSIVITPHVNFPMPQDELTPAEKDLLKAGLYNAGFIAVNQSEEAFEFLQWWKSQLQKYCFDDQANGLFVDQIWLNFVPLFFKSSIVFRNPGYNVAYWNFHERILTEKEEYYINNVPLVFFHYSGYDINAPENLSKYQDRYTFEIRPEFRPLYIKYKEEVLKNNYDDFAAMRSIYGFIKKEQEVVVIERKRTFFQKLLNK